jgi:hypothetical protein
MVPYGRRLTSALVVALVIVALTGAGLAYLARPQRALAGVGQAADLPQGSVSRTASTTPAPGSSTSASDKPPRSVVVSLSPSAENAPQARDVADLIQRYFSAINRHDYDSWLTTVTTAQARRDRDTWTDDYSTTHDSDIYVSDITPGDPLTVRMQFVSHQALAFAPTALPAECVRWDVTYQILDEGVGLRVGTSAKKPAVAPC